MLELFRSFILSIGYVSATSGAISVKNAIYITLFIYLIVNIPMNTINTIYIISHPNACEPYFLLLFKNNLT